MITIICSIIVAAGALVELGHVAPRRRKASLRIQTVPMLLMVTIIGLIVSPVIGLITGAAALIVVIVNTSHANEQLVFSLSKAWPTVLDETATRMASLGDALPTAFFAAAASLPKPLARAVDEGTKQYQLTGDFRVALTPLMAQLAPGASTETVRMLASLAHASASETQATLAQLGDRHREDHNLTTELQAKLSGARLARAFVVVVPVVLFLIGIVIGGGIHSYLNRLGLTMGAIALVMITLCWLWADRYLTPLDQPESKKLYESRLFHLMHWFAP